MESIPLPLILLLIATMLAATSSIIVALFKRPGWSFTDPGVSTLSIIRNPAKYVREPYARAVQILGVTALALAGVTIAGLVVRDLLR